MRLRVFLPTEILLDCEAEKIVAEGAGGSFCLLPKHVDFVAALVPGILIFETDGGEEHYLAVDEGVLVKAGAEVQVSVMNAVEGPELGALRRTVEERFEALDEREKKARSAAARLEADLVRRFLEF